MDQLVDARGARRARREDARGRARRCATRAPSPRRCRPTDDTVRSAARTDVPGARRRRSGACARSTSPLDEVYHHLDTHVLFKLHWGGRGVKGEAWRKLVERGLPAAPGAHVGASRTTCTRAPCSATSPATARATRSSCSTPRTARRCSSASSSRASPSTTASAWPTSTGPKDSGELDVVALQAVTAGDEVTELMAKLEADGEFAEQLFTHGLGVQTAEGMAEWLHAKVRARPRHPARPGPALLVGLPRVPGPVRAREGLPPARRALDRHAPQRRLRRRARAVDGRDRRPPPAGRLLRHEVGLPAQGRQDAPDEIIAGTERDPSTLSDAEPEAVAAE